MVALLQGSKGLVLRKQGGREAYPGMVRRYGNVMGLGTLVSFPNGIHYWVRREKSLC